MHAAHLGNLLFLLLLAVAGLLQLLGRAARKTNKDEQPTSKPAPTTLKPIPRAPAESDEERIRKFLEALGQPAASRPPPPVTPRTNIPPRPLGPVKPPTTCPLPPWKKLHARRTAQTRRHSQRNPLPEMSRRRAQKIFPPAMTGAPAFEVHEEPLADRTAADYQNADGSLRSGYTPHCQRDRDENGHFDLACIEIRFARRDHSPRNFRAATRIARVGNGI